MKKSKNMNIIGREDRLSALPDSILGEILSFLPLQSAIATAILSHRWQHVWTQLPSLIIDVDCYFGTKLNNIISKLTLPLSRSLRVNVISDYMCTDEPVFTDAWFHTLCGSRMHHIQVTCSNLVGRLYRFIAPSTCMFQMQSLVELELGGSMFAWSLPCNIDAMSNLPNLKKLRISVICFQFGLLGKLVSSIPSLEDLEFMVNCSLEHNCHRTRQDFNAEEVSSSLLVSPNLKRLQANLPYTYLRLDVIVDAPRLQYLSITSSSRRFWFVKVPAMLLEADISDLTDKLHGRTMYDVFEAVSNARSIVFDCKELDVLPLYPNLTSLTFKMNSSNEVQGLLNLLRSCPVLEKLMLKLLPPIWPTASDFTGSGWTWSPSDATPRTMLIHVKIIQLELCFSLCKAPYPLNLIKYMLSSARALERLDIKVNGVPRSYQHKELEFFKELVECQNKLLECQIEYSGSGPVISCSASIY